MIEAKFINAIFKFTRWNFENKNKLKILKQKTNLKYWVPKNKKEIKNKIRHIINIFFFIEILIWKIL